ncbi:MAG: hypothetical protein P8Y05_08015, partial [Deinococcales bacterium]
MLGAQRVELAQGRVLQLSGERGQDRVQPLPQRPRPAEQERNDLEFQSAHLRHLDVALAHPPDLRGRQRPALAAVGLHPGVEPGRLHPQVIDHEAPHLGGDGVEDVARRQHRGQLFEHRPLPFDGGP